MAELPQAMVNDVTLQTDTVHPPLVQGKEKKKVTEPSTY